MCLRACCNCDLHFFLVFKRMCALWKLLQMLAVYWLHWTHTVCFYVTFCITLSFPVFTNLSSPSGCNRNLVIRAVITFCSSFQWGQQSVIFVRVHYAVFITASFVCCLINTLFKSTWLLFLCWKSLLFCKL